LVHKSDYKYVANANLLSTASITADISSQGTRLSKCHVLRTCLSLSYITFICLTLGITVLGLLNLFNLSNLVYSNCIWAVLALHHLQSSLEVG